MRLIKKLSRLYADVVYEVLALLATIPNRVYYSVPYVCQYAGHENALTILERRSTNPEKAILQQEGAESLQEYAQWSRAICGMACVSMAIKFFKKTTVPLITLAKDAYVHEVYVMRGSEISGMQYEAFSKWILKFKLGSEVRARLSIDGICFALSQNKLPIVSVSPYIGEVPSRKGGHLVLVTGYDLVKKVLIFHNPSGFKNRNTQENCTMPMATFNTYFAGRGVLVHNLLSGNG